MPSPSQRPPAVVCALFSALPALAGCFAGGLDRAQVPRGRVCFGEPPIALSLETSATFLDETGEAPEILGRLLALGAERMLRTSRIFAHVGEPGRPLTSAPHRVVRLEGAVLDFELYQDFRWMLIYGGILSLPLFGVTAVVVILFLAGMPVYTDRGAIEVELRLRDVASGELLGCYRGAASSDFDHDLYTYDEYQLSFWSEPQVLFALALRRAIGAMVQDRRALRRAAQAGA